MSGKLVYLVLSLIFIVFISLSLTESTGAIVESQNLPSYEEEICFDFNETDEGWTTGGYADWEWGDPSFVIDGKAWETNLQANYFNNSCGWIDSPLIRIGPDGGWMTFDVWENVEADWDGWNVQISQDGGTSWSVIEPVDGYDQGVPNGACDEGLGGDTFAQTAFQSVKEFDLAAYPNTSVKIRIIHQSDGSVSHPGPTIDNVCIVGGSISKINVQCQLLNPDLNGDGIRDVHVGELMYYSATFMNLTEDEVGYGASHFFYAGQSCADLYQASVHLGPSCKGILPGNGIATHYFAVPMPDDDHLVNYNPYALEVEAWECVGGQPVNETGRCCFNFILLPGWGPPPAPEPINGFVIEEMESFTIIE